jgi:Phosphorylase superfamily
MPNNQPPDPPPCLRADLPSPDWPDALVVPQGAEFKAVQRGLARSGCTLPIIPIAIGPGPTAARLAAAIASGQLRSGMRVLALGLAGGLGPVAVGDRVIYGSCAWEGGQGDFDEQGNAWLRGRLTGGTIGEAWSSDRLVGTAEFKRSLWVQTGATCVDMETSALWEVLDSAGLSLAVVRVISDDAMTNLPDLDGTVDGDGNLRPLALAGAFLRKPIGAAALIQGSLRGLARLEETVIELFGTAKE